MEYNNKKLRRIYPESDEFGEVLYERKRKIKSHEPLFVTSHDFDWVREYISKLNWDKIKAVHHYALEDVIVETDDDHSYMKIYVRLDYKRIRFDKRRRRELEEQEKYNHWLK